MEPRCPQCRQIFDPKTLKLDEQKIDSMKNIVPCKWCQKQVMLRAFLIFKQVGGVHFKVEGGILQNQYAKQSHILLSL